MKQAAILFLFLATLILTACNESTDTADNDNRDTVASNNTNVDSALLQPAYDPALEPLTVGAAFSKKLADTLGMKMYEFTLKPGDSAALHAHPDHVVYVLQGGKGMISLNGGPPQEMELKTGMGFITGSVQDAGKNIGKTTIKLLVVDVYRPRGR